VRILLAQDLWDSVAADQDSIDLTDEQRAEIDRRLARFEADPQNVLTWEQAKAKLHSGGQ